MHERRTKLLLDKIKKVREFTSQTPLTLTQTLQNYIIELIAKTINWVD